MTTSRGTPQYGVRFELMLVEREEESAVYREEIHLPEESMEQRVRLHVERDPEVLDGRPDASEGLPEWARRYRQKQWKMLTREAKKSGLWPRKLRRWQGAPGEPI